MNPLDQKTIYQDPTQQQSMMRLQNAYKGLMQNSGNPKSRPEGWFIESHVKSPTQPQEAAGGKWICSQLLREGLLSWMDYLRLMKAHAYVIFRHPNFAYWYLKNGQILVKRAKQANFNWKKFSFESLDEMYNSAGFEAAFKMYQDWCFQLWNEFGEDDMQHWHAMSLGLPKMLVSKWFWNAMPTFCKLRFRGI